MSKIEVVGLCAFVALGAFFVVDYLRHDELMAAGGTFVAWAIISLGIVQQSHRRRDSRRTGNGLP